MTNKMSTSVEMIFIKTLITDCGVIRMSLEWNWQWPVNVTVSFDKKTDIGNDIMSLTMKIRTLSDSNYKEKATGNDTISTTMWIQMSLELY